MEVRFAKVRDVDTLLKLLMQVLEVHHEGRPDIFTGSTPKYDGEDLKARMMNPDTPTLVAVDEEDHVLGYAMCMIQHGTKSAHMNQIETMYIEDLCVDQDHRREGVGAKLYEAVKSYASQIGCARVTLNVWSFNTSALHFYESMGLSPLSMIMEQKIEKA